MTLLELLGQVREELSGCDVTSIVSFESGLSLAASADIETHDAAAADAFGSVLYRLLRNAVEDAGLEGAVDDIVIQSPARTLVSTQLGDTGYFWHLSTRPDITLGFTQAVMRKYHGEVEQGVRELLGFDAEAE